MDMDGPESTAVKHLLEAESELAALDARRSLLEAEFASIKTQYPVLVAEVAALCLRTRNRA
jgi:hypothetical protein